MLSRLPAILVLFICHLLSSASLVFPSSGNPKLCTEMIRDNLQCFYTFFFFLLLVQLKSIVNVKQAHCSLIWVTGSRGHTAVYTMRSLCRGGRSNFLIHALQKCQQKVVPKHRYCSSYHFLFGCFPYSLRGARR